MTATSKVALGDGNNGPPIRPDDDRLTAYHEAGHAVAALMRDGTVLAVSIQPDGVREGSATVQVPDYYMAFVVYAGPWSEARAQWDGPLHGEDDAGLTFDGYVARAFARNADGDLKEYLRLSVSDAAIYGDLNTWLTYSSEMAWSVELEAKWEVIAHVAELLLGGSKVTPERVQQMLG